MAMRNFWMEGRIDGRTTVLTGGPRRKEDGLTISVCQRNEGESQEVLDIRCFEQNDGELTTRVYGPDGEVVFEHTTVR